MSQDVMKAVGLLKNLGGEIISNVILFFCMFIMVVAVPYQFIRNNWVYNRSIEAIDEGLDEYNKLPSYDYMLYRKFWVWDIEELKRCKND